jgi:hypothetical protein
VKRQSSFPGITNPSNKKQIFLVPLSWGGVITSKILTSKRGNKVKNINVEKGGAKKKIKFFFVLEIFTDLT